MAHQKSALHLGRTNSVWFTAVCRIARIRLCPRLLVPDRPACARSLFLFVCWLGVGGLPAYRRRHPTPGA